MKGGTALNFFVRELPRLSVDIDLAWLPTKEKKSVARGDFEVEILHRICLPKIVLQTIRESGKFDGRPDGQAVMLLMPAGGDKLMTKVAILPVPTERGGISYRALAGDKRSLGRTAGEALDALTIQLSDDKAGTLVIVQNQLPDCFFDAAQQQRLAELMERWRLARDRGETLPFREQSELETLVKSELRASADRTDALVKDLKR